MAQPVGEQENMQVLLVSLGEQAFGIPIAQIQDVLGAQTLTKVPMAHEAVSGIMNLRGRLVMVVNLRRRLKADMPASGGDAMSIVIENNGELFSLMVDGVGGVITLKTQNIEDPPITLNPVWREVCNGVYQLPDKVLVLLDTMKIFQAESA